MYERRKMRLAWGIVLLLAGAGLTLIALSRFGPPEEIEPMPEQVEMAMPVVGKIVEPGGGWVAESHDNGEVHAPASIDIAEKCVSCDLPMVAIIVDDFGYNPSLAKRFAAVSVPLTWSIIPGLGGTPATRRIAEESGIPYMIHLPMQATTDREGDKWFKLNWIVSGMSEDAVRSAVRVALEQLPAATALNNHRGSLSTKDAALMLPLMTELSAQHLAFIDSRTAKGSVAYRTAKEAGLPTLYNSVFLDHSSDPAFMEQQMGRLVRQAESRGWAIAICHVRASTLSFLEAIDVRKYPGVRFATIPDLLACASP